MTNHEIAAVFEQIADLLEFQDANPFRVPCLPQRRADDP